MKLKDIIDYMEKWAPNEIVDSWDNTGFQIGREDKDIRNIMVALDLDEYILKESIEKDIDLIITHHPVIFQSLKSVVDINPKGKLILDIIENDIAAYNAHSNLDLANGGVSDVLASKLKLKNLSNLKDLVVNDEYDNKYGYGRIGELASINLESFISEVKKVLDIENLVLYGDVGRIVRKVAVCGGSGSDFIIDAVKKNADIYITGDIKYHEAQFAYERGLTILDIGHFHSEKHILPAIKKYLEEGFKTLNIDIVMKQTLPQKIY